MDIYFSSSQLFVSLPRYVFIIMRLLGSWKVNFSFLGSMENGIWDLTLFEIGIFEIRCEIGILDWNFWVSPYPLFV